MRSDRTKRLLRSVHTALALTATLLVGSATPVTLLKPTPAYAQVCGDGAACGTGVAHSASYSTPEGQTISETITATATGPFGGITGGYVSTNPAHGTVSLSGTDNETFTYTPAAGFTGSDSFVWTPECNCKTTYPATITITVTGPQAPTANNGAISIAYDTPGSTTLTGAGTITSYAIASIPSHGSAALSGSIVTYTPAAGYSGADSFTFQAIGPGGTSNPATISVTVAAPSAPTVSNATITTPYDTPGSVALSSTGVVTSFTLASGPSHGAATVSGSTAIYTPDSGYVGTDSFTVYATGPGGKSNTATVAVTVAAPAAPTASNGTLSTAYKTSGSTTLSATGVVTSFSLVAGPSHGSVSLSGAVATYTPATGYTGADSFTFEASGPGGNSSPATISVTVGAPPAPLAANGVITTPYETPATVTLPGSGAISSYAIVGDPTHGTVALSSASVTYTPASGYAGTDSFTYDVTGPGGTSAPATISVTVQAPPAPSASNGAITTPYNTTASTTLIGLGVISTYAIVSGPSHGSVSLSGSTATYTPAAGYIGADSFTFRVTGPGGASTPATITVSVGAPAAPVASNGTITTAYDTPVSMTLSASGVVSSWTFVTVPSHGAVSLSGSTATYTPQAGYIGSDSFTYVAVGPGGTSSVTTIAVTVEPPAAPVANSGAITCPYQTTCTTTLTSTGLGSTYTVATQASNGTCTISGATLSYTPAWGAVGSDSCTFTVTGPGGTSAPAVIYITNEPLPLPDPSGPTGTPIPTSGASTAICLAGQAASIPGLPGPPTGNVYDPNWCDAQALTIAQQALRLTNQQSQVSTLQSQLAVQQKMVQGLGSDSTSSTLATVNAAAAKILQQATGIGFNAQGAGAAFSAAYPGGETVAGFNGSQLSAALQTWQANTAQALQTSIAMQNQIAQSQARVTGAIQNAVNASNGAPGATAAHQATNQILAAVSTQLAQLQDILLAEAQAYAVVSAARQQAGGAAAATAAQAQGQVAPALTAPPGVTDTTRM
jgi:P-type conjugative transfer protein TrbJ